MTASVYTDPDAEISYLRSRNEELVRERDAALASRDAAQDKLFAFTGRTIGLLSRLYSLVGRRPAIS